MQIQITASNRAVAIALMILLSPLWLILLAIGVIVQLAKLVFMGGMALCYYMLPALEWWTSKFLPDPSTLDEPSSDEASK